MTRVDVNDPGKELTAFLAESHLGTLTVVKRDGDPHVTAVGFSYDPQTATARVITWQESWKSRHLGARPDAPAAICSVDGGRWITLSGHAIVTNDQTAIDEGVQRYAERYRQPAERPDRVVIEIAVEKIVGRG